MHKEDINIKMREINSKEVKKNIPPDAFNVLKPQCSKTSVLQPPDAVYLQILPPDTIWWYILTS